MLGALRGSGRRWLRRGSNRCDDLLILAGGDQIREAPIRPDATSEAGAHRKNVVETLFAQTSLTRRGYDSRDDGTWNAIRQLPCRIEPFDTTWRADGYQLAGSAQAIDARRVDTEPRREPGAAEAVVICRCRGRAHREASVSDTSRSSPWLNASPGPDYGWKVAI